MGVRTEKAHDRPIESASVPVWFISPHGFGHAARASAVIAACSSRRPDLHHHIFTTVPVGFFSDSLPGVPFVYHRLECDIGMVQKNPVEEDLGATIRALERLPLNAGSGLDAVVSEVASTGCNLMVSDISPLGLVVADRLGVPGILVENFTWDWIYQPYGDPRLDDFGDRMREIFSTAALRIQTEPVCQTAVNAHRLAPVSRKPRSTTGELRARIGIPTHHRMVLVSLSGLEPEFLRKLLQEMPATTLVAPEVRPEIDGEREIIRIPTTGGPYHPDLVMASDLVIGKLGYSTVAELYQAETAFAFLRRPRFPESPILEAFVRDHITSTALPEDWFESPTVPSRLEELLTRPRPTGLRPNGAGDAADLILDRLP